MVATEALKKDHRVIEKMIDILEKVSHKIDNGEDVPADILKNSADFIRNFADNYHHGKEEDLLFKKMEEKGFPIEGGPVGVMLIEHDEGRGYARAMAEAAEQYAAGDSGAKKIFADNARNYGSLLLPHIQKEDGILYMMANNLIPEDAQQELLGIFNMVEKEKLGENGRQRYVDLVDEIEKAV